MKIYKILAVMVLVVFAMTACNKKKNVLLKVNDEVITTDDFKARLQEASYYYNPAFVATEQGKVQVLDGVEKESVMLALAKKKGYDKKEDYLTQFKNFQRQVLITNLIKDLRNTELSVSEQEVKDSYNKDKAYYDNPKQLKMAHILVMDKALADKLLEQIKQGSDFAVLASSYSIDTSSAKNGGELEWFGKGDMVPEFEAVAFSLINNGDLSGVVKTNFGFHILKKIDERIGQPISYESVQLKIRKILEKEKFDKWYEKEKSKMSIKKNDKLLKDISL